MSIGKFLFIVIKVALIIFMMSMGMVAHFSRTQKFGRVFRLFIYYMIIMMLLCYYEFLSHEIFVLYLIVILCGFGQIASIDIFMDQASNFQEEETTKWQKKFIYGFTALYFIFLTLTPMPMIGATCHEDLFIYPLCFMIFWYTQYVFFAVTTYFYVNDYFMDEDIVEQMVQIELKFDQDL